MRSSNQYQLEQVAKDPVVFWICTQIETPQPFWKSCSRIRNYFIKTCSTQHNYIIPLNKHICQQFTLANAAGSVTSELQPQ